MLGSLAGMAKKFGAIHTKESLSAGKKIPAFWAIS